MSFRTEKRNRQFYRPAKLKEISYLSHAIPGQEAMKALLKAFLLFRIADQIALRSPMTFSSEL
jgi:hypothetical protein